MNNSNEMMAVINAVNRVAISLALYDWKRCRECFADEVEVDYTSLYGGEIYTLLADDLIKKWQSTIAGFDAMQHLFGSHSVEINNDTAQCVSLLQAKHILRGAEGGEDWTLGALYRHGLILQPEGWRINKLHITVIWSEGNDKLLELAASRTKNQNITTEIPLTSIK